MSYALELKEFLFRNLVDVNILNFVMQNTHSDSYNCSCLICEVTSISIFLRNYFTSKSTETGKLSSKPNAYQKATKMEALSTEEIDLISSSWDLVAADEAGNGQQFFA